jgi:antitoxin CptB
MNTTEPADDRRKRLRYRAWHRGTREMDLVLGRFAETAVVPPNYDTPILHRIIAFHRKGPK